jgi:putative membrane protein
MSENGEAMDSRQPQGQDGPDRRTTLAADRTVFAAERTYAAWVRTGLAALASGVGARRLLEGHVPEWVILLGGTVLVLLSAFSFCAGVWRQVLHPGSLPPEGDTKRIYPPILISVNTALVIVAISALIGIWAGGEDSG